MDQHVDGVAFDLLAPSIKTIFELSARQDRPGPLHERAHQRKLPGRQDNVLLAAAERVLGEIEAKIAGMEERFGRAAAPPRHGANAREKLLSRERLHNIIIRA